MPDAGSSISTVEVSLPELQAARASENSRNANLLIIVSDRLCAAAPFRSSDSPSSAAPHAGQKYAFFPERGRICREKIIFVRRLSLPKRLPREFVPRIRFGGRVCASAMSMLSIREVDKWTPSLAEAFGRLLPQLSPPAAPFGGGGTGDGGESATALFAAWRDMRIVGLLTLTWYRVPSGCKAWIEDVVVDEAARGLGIGERLVRAALEARCVRGRPGAAHLPRISRAAHALYHKTGF